LAVLGPEAAGGAAGAGAPNAASAGVGAPGAAGGGAGGGKKKKKGGKSGTDIYKIVRMIMERKYEPVIIFSFSKRDCEEHALHMSKLDFCNGMLLSCHSFHPFSLMCHLLLGLQYL
jgi:hypothetical protein